MRLFVHIAFNEKQAALLQAQALAEVRSVNDLIRSAAIRYCYKNNPRFKVVILPELTEEQVDQKIAEDKMP